ncbi:DUF1289 domain-containing protein [Pleionea litopenaei]|uniref:DUF1289 domain-containing protein n=1 Tax=Pleionea litopenaei TaxID=3070815 RepID=A0AA51RUR2_9GAMM|nr:DUF1289 domain-containing protein [Pleionea sp. HL-JVS1]WMS87991.1 DUF1289 domain-containing protein [Pleionea sp. HL-JVS1]
MTLPLVKSPCIGICKLVAKDQAEICSGCQRTVDEIIAWPTMTNAQRQQVLDRIKHNSVNPLK